MRRVQISSFALTAAVCDLPRHYPKMGDFVSTSSCFKENTAFILSLHGWSYMMELMTRPETDAQAGCVLVVDDEISTRYLLAEQLRRVGFVVYEASSADEAVILLESRTAFDAVITDVQMPGDWDGLRLAEFIRNRSPSAVVVVVSGMNVAEQAERHGTKFFQKPYSGASVVDYVKTRLALL